MDWALNYESGPGPRLLVSLSCLWFYTGSGELQVPRLSVPLPFCSRPQHPHTCDMGTLMQPFLKIPWIHLTISSLRDGAAVEYAKWGPLPAPPLLSGRVSFLLGRLPAILSWSFPPWPPSCWAKTSQPGRPPMSSKTGDSF